MATDEQAPIRARVDRIRQIVNADSSSEHFFEAAALGQSVVHDTVGGGHPLMAAIGQALVKDSGWGIFPTTGNPNYLGVAKDKVTQLVIAKFVFDGNHNNWHGYPANHMANEHDIPDESVLKNWIDKSVLPLAKISKIGKGKPCKL